MKKYSNFTIAKRLMTLVKPLLGYMALAILLGVIGHLAATFIGVLGGFGVVHMAGVSDIKKMTAIFVLMGIFALTRGIFRYGEQTCNHYIAFKLLALIRDKVFKALRRLCPAKLDGKDKGDLISVITSDIELLEVFYAHTISPVAIAAIYSLVMVIFIGSYYWALGLLAAVAYFTVGVLIPIVFSKSNGDNGMKSRNLTAGLSAMVLDNLRGLGEIIQFNSAKKRMEKMEERAEEMAKMDWLLKKNMGCNMAVTNAAILLFDVAMIVLAMLLFSMGMVNGEGMILPIVSLFFSFGPVIALANLGSTLQHTFAAGGRVLAIMDEEPVVKEVNGKKNVQFTQMKVGDVTFSYDEEEILRKMSVGIKDNTIIGITGKSGSGKSTLLKLMMRFWDADEGEISIAGRNIKEINTENLREMESLVSQDTQLFHDSIAANIRVGKIDATDEEVREACKKAAIHDFIEKLPNGYDTEVGELGETLSGGERQRIGVARAFLHDAPLMLLDEPTSNLDSLNEGTILRVLEQEKGQRTVILVSHRESTMAIVDEAYSVERGRIS